MKKTKNILGVVIIIFIMAFFTPLQKGDVVYDDNFTKLQIEGIRL